MKSAQEIEIKFAAPADVLPRLQHQLPAKGIRTAKPKSVVSVYFDTDKLDLRKHGLTLRVRRNGRQRRRPSRRKTARQSQPAANGSTRYSRTSRISKPFAAHRRKKSCKRKRYAALLNRFSRLG
jgi:uncharacterized protein YjbK